MGKPIAVLAGSFRQFQEWMREQNLSGTDAVYVSDQRHCMGTEFSRVEKIGDWYIKPGADRLTELAATRVR